ncbi:hypothetical protein YYE_03449 [Plasmodium vinckei vinckei]|nr:hypothetical protein YYE_03449 [Plasmodium vinckei vinckei]
MKITFSLFFILVIVTKLNSKSNVYCANDYINDSREIKYAPYTFDLSSYDLGSQDNLLINLEHNESKQNLRKKRSENPLEHLEESHYNTEEYMARNDANDTSSHEHQEYETPNPEYPEQHSSTHEQYATSNINESPLDTKLDPEPFEHSGPSPHFENPAPAEANHDREHPDANEFIGAPGHHPHVDHVGPTEASYNTENVYPEPFEHGGPSPHFENPAPREANHDKEHPDENEFIGAPGAPHFDNPASAEANHDREHPDANEFIGAPGLHPHVDHAGPPSTNEDSWAVIANNEYHKEVNEPSYKTAEINQIFIKGIDLCKDIFEYRMTKSTYKNENNGNNEVTPEEPENNESHQITVDARNEIDPLPTISKVYIIDNTLEQYMKDIHSILINIQNIIEKSKTVVE